MFSDHFYNQRTRMSVAVFGAMFNNLYIIRTSGNKVLSQMKVPLSYAPKRKFLERISEMNAAGDRDIENQLAIKLPRMSFEITAIAYDPQRQLPKTNYYRKPHVDNDKKSGKFHVSTPYTITFELNIYGKQHDDCLQVVEQIIPYFNPQYTVNVKPIDDYPEIVEDVPVILSSVTFSDNFEGALEDRRTIIYTLGFEMKISYFGPKPPESGVIENIDVDFFNDWPSDFSPPQDPEYLETIRIGTDPSPVSEDSDYTVVTDIINEHSPDSDFVNPDIPHPYK
jgi:hypothetical protein